MGTGHDARETPLRRALRRDRWRRASATPPAGDDPVARALAEAVAAALPGRPLPRIPAPRGANAERDLRRTIETLRRHGWTSLHGLHRPGHRGATIDHVLVGPGGIVVVDIDTAAREVPRTGGTSADRRPVPPGLAALVEDVASVAALVAPHHRTTVTALVCPSGESLEVSTAPGAVTVVGRERLAAHLVGLPPRLTPFDVADAARRLGRELGGRLSPELLTTAELDQLPVGGTADPRDTRLSGTRGSRARRAAAATSERPPGRATAPARSHARAVVLDLVALLLVAGLVLALWVDPQVIAAAGSSFGDFVASWFVPESLLPGDGGAAPPG
jgi:hypothetical protein